MPGDRVFGVAQGAYGERIVVKPDQVQPLPHALSFDQGAGTCQRSPCFLADDQSRAK